MKKTLTVMALAAIGALSVLATPANASDNDVSRTSFELRRIAQYDFEMRRRAFTWIEIQALRRLERM